MSNKLSISKHSPLAHRVGDIVYKKTINQKDAVEALLNLIDKFEGGFYDHDRPIGSLLFLGPTGSGKTYTVENLVHGLCGDSKRMIKIDCAEFQHSHEIAKLVGSPPGYLGHRETHPLICTERIQKVQGDDLPFVVILFDEVEKASDSLWNLLLGILDKGSLTTGSNETVDLRNTVIVMTSNIGSKELAEKVGEVGLGFQAADFSKFVSGKDLKKTAVNAARRKFMPEFMNRLDDVIMFNTLTEEDIKDILEVQLEDMRVLFRKRDCPLGLLVSPSAKTQIIKEGYDKKYNARALRRVIEKYVMLPLSRAHASLQIQPGDRIVVDYKGGEFEYYGTSAAKA